MIASAGELRHEVAIQKPNDGVTADDFGTIDLTNGANWTHVATRRAKIEPHAGGETFAGRQVQAQITHVVTLWCEPVIAAIGARWRIVHGARRLHVERAYTVGEEGRQIECQCCEVAP